MTSKAFFGILLSSSVVATIVTITWESIFVSRAEREKIDLSEMDHALNFVQIVNTVVRGEAFSNAVSRQDFLLTVLKPLYEDKHKYVPIILEIARLDASVDRAKPGNADDVAVTSVDSVRTTNETIQTLQSGPELPDEYSVEAIRNGLFSGYRRQLSDALVREIDNGRDDLPERLILALVDDPEDPRSYRINLYIAYTLARVEEWSAPADSISAFKRLTETKNYKDETFERRVNEAISRIQV